MISLSIDQRLLYDSTGVEFEIPRLPTEEEANAYVVERESQGVAKYRALGEPEYPFAKHDNELFSTLVGMVEKGTSTGDNYFRIDPADFGIWAPTEIVDDEYIEFPLKGIIWSDRSQLNESIPVGVEVSSTGARISLLGGSCECSRTLDDGRLINHNLDSGDFRLITLGAIAYNHIVLERKTSG